MLIAKYIAKNVKTHHCQLSIRKEFINYNWDYTRIKKYTIMSNAQDIHLKDYTFY